jgi:hypothetical protein
MSTSYTKVEIGWVSLLFSGVSVLTFFMWLVLASPTSTPRARGSPQVELNPTPVSLICPRQFVKENVMQGQASQSGDSHIEAHIDLCPDHSFHMKVGNVCLHLCRKDFLKLARAVARAVTPDDAIANAENKNLHNKFSQ